MDIKLVESLQGINLVEAFNNWTYKPSQDPKTLVFDFYLLSALPEPKRDENLKVALEDSRKVLYNFLKNEILHAIKFVIADEFNHIYVLNKKQDVIAFLESYGFKVTCKKGYPGFKADRAEEFVKAAEVAFTKFKWYKDFGGKYWSFICKAWLELFNQQDKSLGVLAADIDHIYNIEHNTGLLYSKLDGYTFLKSVLNFKRDSKHEYNFFDKVSSDLKLFAAAVIKDAEGTDYEGWLKGDKSTRFFPRQDEKVIIKDSKYIYNFIPSFVTNMSGKIDKTYSINEAKVINNFKYIPLLPMNRLYLVETVNGERLLIDERGLKSGS
jgi:hypothetical protein